MRNSNWTYASWYFVLCGFLFTAILAAVAFAQPIRVTTIYVGPNDPVKTLHGVVWRDNLVVRLRPGTHDVFSSIHIRNNNVHILPADWSKMPTIRYRPDTSNKPSGWMDAAFWFKGDTQSIQGVKFQGNTRTELLRAYGARSFTAYVCEVLPGSAGLGQIAHGSDGVTIWQCWADAMDRNFVFVGEGEVGILDTYVNGMNRNIVFRDCYWGTSRYEHGIRVHAGENVTIDKCRGNNQSAQLKADVKIHDGKNVLIVDSRFEGNGLNGIGPLADGNGGLYDPPGMTRERKLGLRLRGVTVRRTFFNSALRVSAGTSGLYFEAVTVAGNMNTGAHVSFDGAYGPRPRPAGWLKRVAFGKSSMPPINYRPPDVKIMESTWKGKPYKNP